MGPLADPAEAVENGDDRRVTMNTEVGLMEKRKCSDATGRRFGFGGDVHTGGCVNYAASRVFVMRRAGTPGFPEVIKHIEEALNPATFPPLRDGHDWDEPSYPPARLPANGKRKDIPENWAEPENEPLVRVASESEAKQNRG
ncbi:hypothetical protein Aple_072950 [Acrocarpospora pleiomorpha]|uniref:Uncharacterized protein n=1 Tax=Acrocarpospora pleiomorpha TaxID=90975 RepID=A0A5M3XU38_9ACTN|nr:hypothetical protein [Acrocarpospora pleiomorpha]GES24396.1 hypothetical protein Aple_072950 [Acrocarpospora pleiomorpha]